MKTAEDLGLYSDLPPDATVDGMVEDPGNPGWVETHFSDGRVATLPKDHAESLPQTPAAPMAGTYDDSAGGFAGPPPAEQVVTPGQEPMLPEELAATGGTPPPGSGGGTPFLGAGAPGASPLGAFAGGASAAGANQLENAPTPTTTGTPTVAEYQDPNAALVSPGAAPGQAPFSTTQSQSDTTSSTVETPEAMQARTAAAGDAEAQALRTRDQMAFTAKRASLLAEENQRAAQQAQLALQQRKAELEIAEHARVIKAMEKTPIDEDGFWTESPGRAAGAWIALALSGFLQGATKGQNPALGQMVQALNHAQDRWLDAQQKNRASVLAQRTKLMGSAENARDSLKAQIAGVVNRRIDLDAQKAGLVPPPGLETYKAQQAVRVAEHQNAIGARIDRQATVQAAQETRATPGTGPQRQADVVLKNLLGPDYQKKHAEAMNPKKLNLGGVVGGAQRLQDISEALDAIAKANGGDLQAKTPLSWDNLGLAGVAARLGVKNAQTQVNTKQLLEEAKLAYKQTVNIKSIDSENEGKNFNAIMDSGESGTTLAAIRQKAGQSAQNAVSIADGVAPGAAQQYLEYVRSTQDQNRGTRPTPDAQRADAAGRVTFQPLAPGGGAEAGAVQETTGGGPAPERPLAPQPAGAVTASGQTGTYQRGRYRKQP